MTAQAILWLVALVLFAVATFWEPAPATGGVRPRLVPAGLAFLTLGYLWPLLAVAGS